MNDEVRDAYQKIIEKEFPNFVQILETCVDFRKWGFKQTFYGIAEEFAPSIIYDSASCRVRFEWNRGEPKDGYNILRIRYGRLHAPDDRRFIIWNGRLSHCWHQLNLALNFLDGLSPNEAVERQNKWPYVIDQFIQANKGRTWSEMEWTARAHATVWEHYGHSLFHLFDLHYPDTWEQFAYFVKEFYRLNPGAHDPNEPFPELVC